MEFFGDINFLKAGIVFADRLNTVSRKYAEEIQTRRFGFGLDGLLREAARGAQRNSERCGLCRWNPETDAHIPANLFGLGSGRQATSAKPSCCGKWGCRRRAHGRPLLGFISRFTGQKGFDLIADAAPELFRRRHLSGGAGKRRSSSGRDLFRDLQAEFPGAGSPYSSAMTTRWRTGSRRAPTSFSCPAGTSHAGSIRFTACAMERSPWCALPAVWTIRFPVLRHGKRQDSSSLITMGRRYSTAIRQAELKFQDRKAWTAMMVRGMKKDFSWTVSALEYSALYSSLAADSESPGAPGDSKSLNED